MKNNDSDLIKEQAIRLARDNKQAEPAIQRIFWFGDDSEIRLIEVEDGMMKSLSGRVEPFYFEPAPGDGIDFPSGIALIHPEEVERLTLPEDWGDWRDAVDLTDEIGNGG